MQRQESWCCQRPERRGDKRRSPCEIVLLSRVLSAALATAKELSPSTQLLRPRLGEFSFLQQSSLRRERRLPFKDGVGQSVGLSRVSSLLPTLEGTCVTGHRADHSGPLTSNSGCRHSTTTCRACYWALMTSLWQNKHGLHI